MIKTDRQVKTVGICGFGFSGSGAVVDMLKELDDFVYIKSGEFYLSYAADGLRNLDYNINTSPIKFISSDTAIKRFRRLVKQFCKDKHLDGRTTRAICDHTEDYINEITQVQWKGYWRDDYLYMNRMMKSLFQYSIAINKKLCSDKCGMFSPIRTMRLSKKVDGFIPLTQKYVEDVLLALNGEDSAQKIYLVDQPFSADSPEKDMVYFRDSKAIIVDRDPRDIYILAKYNTQYNTSWIPTDDIKKFIQYYTLVYSSDPGSDPDKVLHVRFEDMIFQTESTSKRILGFLGLGNREFKHTYFDPRISINNTRIYKRYLKKEENQIQEIEKSLSGSLYDFSSCSSSSPSETPFF